MSQSLLAAIPWQNAGIATAVVLTVSVLLKLVLLEWFSRKKPAVRRDVLLFARLLFAGRSGRSRGGAGGGAGGGDGGTEAQSTEPGGPEGA
ncbi:hypothetical protein [Actinacidiphila sp. bgisy160]|uniref:hypothetical protein n=1 Tax=Actinacidiphila sp. bgisy160 TaxID=3413796 RepID=UPI003D729AA5